VNDIKLVGTVNYITTSIQHTSKVQKQLTDEQKKCKNKSSKSIY